MGERLHIPLSRSHKTTRRSWWVVWLLVVLLGFGFIVFSWTRLFFLSSTRLFIAAPEGTIGAAQLFINPKTKPVLERVLRNVPLISNRNFTLEDLEPITHGELIWFFLDDGSRVVAIRSQKSDLKTPLFDANHIIVQPIGNNMLLLSDKLQAISGLKVKHPRFSFSSIFNAPIGNLYEKDHQKLSAIFQDKNGLIIPLQEKNANNIGYRNLDFTSLYLYLHTPVSTNQKVANGFLSIFTPIAGPLLSESSISLFSNFSSMTGDIILKNPQNPVFLVSMIHTDAQADRSKLIQTILSVSKPTMTSRSLPDSTTIQEIIADPSLIPVEEITVGGTEFFHASNGNDGLFVSKNDPFIFTNDEETLKEWLQEPQKEHKKAVPCDVNTAYLSMKSLAESKSYPTNAYSSDVFRLLGNNLSAIGVKTSGKQEEFHLCF
ncbi:hypothetical protein HZA85_01825 [Candidatus Uhrbacteria bacterium]|nr:hypothetical protein [Candidatus Uhrbacteria bacterium]